MKIIDLLNKIANGEEVPNFIVDEVEYYMGANGYLRECMGDDTQWYIDKSWLNTEVEIIEEEKKIPEKLDVELVGQCDNWLRYGTTEEIIKDNELNPYIIENIRNNTLAFQHKINEIIDYLKSKGE